jgi:hypothetical protein
MEWSPSREAYSSSASKEITSILLLLLLLLLLFITMKLRNYRNYHIGYYTHTSESADVKVH